MLEVKNLKKTFGSNEVVKGVSLTVEKGEVVGLLGKNGAGKSTTFKMIIGTLKPSSGEVDFLGQDISSWPMHKRCRSGMGYLAQVTTIFRDMTVEDNLLAVMEQLKLSRKERKKRVDQLLSDYKLDDIRKNYASSNSGGEKRRLEIARALVTEPQIILLDEPFAGVDPIAVGGIREMIYGIKERGVAVLITDHNAEQTLKTTERAYIMEKGEVLHHGTPEEVVAHEDCRRNYFGMDFTLDGSPRKEEDNTQKEVPSES
ncbi:MAG: LPS export ABC transporter ATP-binding protein [Planctomycetota bacterium]|nr:LPS export ABC transporter ATP-binding protein [Planctomycetota bacterium]